MGEPAKYAFDRNFGNSRLRPEPPEAAVERRLRQEFETTLADARKQAFEQGRAEGQSAAAKALESRLASAVARLTGAAEDLLNRIDETCRAEAAKALKVAHLTAERLAGQLLQRYPDEVLASIFAECLEHAREAPHLAIRVNDELAETLQKRVTAIAAERGYSGRVVVLGDPETITGDCRIEWADGGITRDFARISGQIADAVERHLKIRAVPAPAAGEPDAPGPSAAAPDAPAVKTQGVLA